MAPAEPITFQQLRDSWDEVLQQFAETHRNAWMVAKSTTPVELRDGDVLVLGFQSDADVQRFRESPPGTPSVADLLRTAIKALLGIEVKYVPRTRQSPRAPSEQPSAAGEEVHRSGSAPAPASDDSPSGASAPAPTSSPSPIAASAPTQSGGRAGSQATASPSPQGKASPSPQTTAAPGAQTGAAPAAESAGVPAGWAVATIPSDAEAPPEDMPEPALPDEPETDPFSFVSAPDTPAPRVTEAKVEPAAAAAAPSPMREAMASAPAPPEPEMSASQAARYGEAVVREELGAELIEERPRVRGER